MERPYSGENPHLALNIYRLYCYFCASQSLESESRVDGGGYQLLSLKLKFEANEIKHLLVSIAAQLRNGRDTAQVVDQRATEQLGLRLTGTLYEPIANPPTPLRFHEACNKILHATKVAFVTTETSPSESWINYYLEPQLHLSGSKERGRRRYEWKAVLEVYPFLRAAAQASTLDWCPLTQVERAMTDALSTALEGNRNRPARP